MLYQNLHTTHVYVNGTSRVHHWSHICKNLNSAVIRSRDAELPLEKVECGEADADAHRSLDPVHAQALEQPCHSLFFQHALCTAARQWKTKARFSAEVRVFLDRIAGTSSLTNGKKTNMGSDPFTENCRRAERRESTPLP